MELYGMSVHIFAHLEEDTPPNKTKIYRAPLK
jgi:hypothetical protein